MLDENEKIRYGRQILNIEEKGQEILKSKKVVQIGAGGLGSPLSYYLTAAGVGDLTIIDDDVVSLSNLNRQILYKTEDIGKSKAILAEKSLSALNPSIKIKGIQDRITHDNFKKYFEGADYIYDASDNMETKFLVNDIGLELNIPFTIAGVMGMEGQIISVQPHETACYRCLFGEPKKGMKKDKEGKLFGIFGFTCGVLGSMEAAEGIKHIIGDGDRLLNTLMMIDLKEMKWIHVNVKRNENCIC